MIFSAIALGLDHVQEYDYLENGADWPNICQTGTQQSPINVNTRSVLKCDENFKMSMEFNNTNLTSETENILVTYKTYANWSTLTLEQHEITYKFDASQFHFHAPSEHTINGEHYDGEIHIVHLLRTDNMSEIPENFTRTVAVLGIFLLINDSAGDHPFFKEYNPTSSEEFHLNISETLGEEIIKSANFFTYDGGLTTPPCGEVVNWFIMDEPIHVTQNQMNKLQNAWAKNATFAGGKGNNRIVLPLNGRVVKAGTMDGKKNLVRYFFILIFLILLNC